MTPERSKPAGAGAIDFLAHKGGDHVAVAVRDVQPGPALVAWLDSPERCEIQVNDQIRFGHKVALAGLAEGDPVIEYGVAVAVTTGPVASGDLVHIHNVRSARWRHDS